MTRSERTRTAVAGCAGGGCVPIEHLVQAAVMRSGRDGREPGLGLLPFPAPWLHSPCGSSDTVSAGL